MILSYFSFLPMQCHVGKTRFVLGIKKDPYAYFLTILYEKELTCGLLGV